MYIQANKHTNATRKESFSYSIDKQKCENFLGSTTCKGKKPCETSSLFFLVDDQELCLNQDNVTHVQKG